MNWLRTILCAAIVLGPCGLAAQTARADAEGVIERAEKTAEASAERAADVDPDKAGGADPLSVDPDLAIWTLVVFVILMLVLGKFAWGPILAALEKREHGIAEHIAQAERNHEEARQLLASYEQKLAGAAQEVRDLLEEARRDAEHTKQSILAEAKGAADAERQRALRDIDTAADAAMESLARRSADLSVELAGKILQSQLSKDDHARLIQEAMSRFPASSSN